MIFTIASKDWGCANLKDIAAVLESVHTVFADCFKDKISNKPLIIKRTYDCIPRCQRNESTIYLSAKDRRWVQYAYQFTHEYCHFQIPADVCSRLRWFEESVCQLASYFFLPLLSELWESNPPYPHWKSFANEFTIYVQHDLKKAEFFDLNLSNPLNPNIAYLLQNEYDRPKNKFIASELLPIFESDPTLWSTIYHLGSISNDLHFDAALKYWYHAVPHEHQESIQRIASIFSLSI